VHDLKAIDARGFAGIKPELDHINQVSDKSALTDVSCTLCPRSGSLRRPATFPATHALDWGWIYRLTFYEGFVVNAWMVRVDNDGPIYGAAIETRHTEHAPSQ
jgi:hypothetical protein